MNTYYFMRTDDWQQLRSEPRARRTLTAPIYIVCAESGYPDAYKLLYSENADLIGEDGRKIECTMMAWERG